MVANTAAAWTAASRGRSKRKRFDKIQIGGVRKAHNQQLMRFAVAVESTKRLWWSAARYSEFRTMKKSAIAVHAARQ